MGRLAPWDGRTGHAWWAVSLQTLLPDTGHMPRAPASLLTVPRLCLPADVATRGGASFWLLVVHAQSLQLCLSLCNPMDLSPLGFPGGTSGKEHACHCRRHKGYGFDPWVGKIPWRRKWQPTPVFLPRESHEQRSLAGYSPWGR